MPELPEVETIRAGLARTVLGARIADVEVLRDRSIRRHDGGAEAFAEAVTGRRIEAAVRRGKFLWLPLTDASPPRPQDTEPPSFCGLQGAQNPSQPNSAGPSFEVPKQALLAHLGMSGQLLVRTSSADDARHPHLRVRLHLAYYSPQHLAARDAGDPEKTPTETRYLDFVDQRTFGHLLVDDLLPTSDGAPGGSGSDITRVPTSAAHIGRDLLDSAFDLDRAVDSIRRRRTGIKRALLDQTVVSGIGNIYADEALWRSRVHFARATDRMRPIDLARLLEAAADVMTESLAQGGTSFDSLYVDVAGESGYFSRALAVYGREGQPCPRCGAEIKRESFMNRSVHYCPICQPRPRGANARF